MKNPFKKDNTTLIAAIAVASVAAGAVAYLFLTENGHDARKSMKKKIKSIAKDAAADAVKYTRISKKAVKAVADHMVK